MDKTTHSIHLINTHRRILSSMRIQLQSKPNNLPKYIHVPREKIAPYHYWIFLLESWDSTGWPKNWFNSSIEEYKQYPVKRLKQWTANTKKLFKINKKSFNYSSNKITDYFSKIRETMEKKNQIIQIRSQKYSRFQIII